MKMATFGRIGERLYAAGAKVKRRKDFGTVGLLQVDIEKRSFRLGYLTTNGINDKQVGYGVFGQWMARIRTLVESRIRPAKNLPEGDTRCRNWW